MKNKRKNTFNNELSLPSGIPADYSQTPENGLTAEAVARMKANGYTNTAPENPGKSVGQIVAGQLFTLFNLLNIALAAVLISVGSYRNILFMGVVISNTVIGTVQELRAYNTIKKLRLLNQPEVSVIRDGIRKVVKSEELVKGDLIVLKGGDQIPADAIICSGNGTVNESVLTGESIPVQKKEGDWLYSGSYITEGNYRAQIVYAGAESYINRLTAAAKQIKPQKTQLMNDINSIIRTVTWLLVPIGIALFCKQYFLQGQELNLSVSTAAAAMIGMIPEGLLLLTSVALAVGVVRLGRKQTLVQELHGIETLARVDVLCLDKTGTLTTGEMSVKEIIAVEAPKQQVEGSLKRFLGAFEDGNASLMTLKKAFGSGNETPVEVVPFSSERKRSAAAFADGAVYVMGAANFVLNPCDLKRVENQIKAAAENGCRVMVFCKTDILPEDGKACQNATILGIITMEDTLRVSCSDTLAYFREQSVDIRVISGDDPVTVSAVARRAGVIGAENYVDASTLDNAEKIKEAIETKKVFGRVTPQQKHALVMALKAQGHCVAMTGDGVNDIPAMKAADCSIAIAGGSDAAKNAAQLTLLNADFSVMPMIVGEGRRVVNNITRAASLFLVKTLYSFALAVLLLLVPAAYPFQPIQLTLVSTFTIGFPTFVLALQPDTERIKSGFIRTVITNAVPAALTVTISAAVCMLLERFGIKHEVCATMAVVAAGVSGIIMLVKVCIPINILRALLLIVCITGLSGTAIVFSGLFYLVPLTTSELLILFGVIAMSICVFTLSSHTISRIMKGKDK